MRLTSKKKKQKTEFKFPFEIDQRILQKIFSFILDEHFCLSLVCSSWNKILLDEEFYKNYLLEKFKTIKKALQLPFFYVYNIQCYKNTKAMEIKALKIFQKQKDCVDYLNKYQQKNIFLSTTNPIEEPTYSNFYEISINTNDFLSEILEIIFSFCSIDVLTTCSNVNKFWYQILNHDSDFWDFYWKSIFMSFKDAILKPFHFGIIIMSSECYELNNTEWTIERSSEDAIETLRSMLQERKEELEDISTTNFKNLEYSTIDKTLERPVENPIKEKNFIYFDFNRTIGAPGIINYGCIKMDSFFSDEYLSTTDELYPTEETHGAFFDKLGIIKRNSRFEDWK